MSEVDIPDIHLKVLYDFEYTTKGGRKVTIREGEKLFLIKKTNSDWWQVIRSSTERPFYVPATYVEEYSWNQTGNSKDISRCSSFKKNTEKKLNTFAPLSEYRTLPSSVSSEKDDILLDKRKSWAVEELVAELSKMRSENAKDKISVEKDKDSENTDELSKKDNINQVGLTDSLEKLAQQIQFDPTVTSSIRSTEKLTQHHFDPVVTSSSRSTPTKLSTSLEEPSPAIEETSGKMDSVFSRVKSKLGYSSSFKTKKELQQVLKKGVGNSVLSTSWEMALSETDGNQKSSHLTLPDEGLMRTSGSGLESVKGEAKVLDTQLKPCRSGGDLDFIDKRSDSKKSPNQSWNLLRNKVRSGKLKQIVCVSESESEEYLDESLGQDEDSVSGLSDDNLLFQSSSSRVYSDISDGAISDDLVIETAGEGRKNQAGSQKRKVSLTRGSRVETHAARHYSSPPSPSPGHQPVRVLTEGWEEYRTPTGRTYYFNQLSRDKSWKPPRRQIKHNESAEDGSVENLRSDSSSPLAEANGSSGTCFVPVPKGWRQEFDDETGQPCYLNETSGAKWFSSNDSEGRIYFFEENSNESSWTLPEVTITSTTCDSPLSTKPVPRGSPVGGKKAAKEEKLQPDGEVQLRSEQTNVEPEIKMQFRMAKAHSMAVLESGGKQASSKSSSIPRNWPQLWDGNMCVLKEGTLNRTKITENGKKVRKNWAPAHVVLTELFLLFFKDAKSFAAMKNTQGESHSTAARPEFSVDLNGAQLEHGEKASSRRNVFLVSALLGLQVLVQCDSAPQAEEWYQAIQKAIADLPSACDSCPRNKTPKLSPQFLGRGSQSPDEFKKSSRIGRSRSVKSVKMTAREGSQEDLTISPEENQTKIRNRLKKFFHRRPTREALVKKGIYKDEPVFGCHLPDVCKGENPRVPAFVQRCVAAIECKEENMKTDGLYRASGNLSQVQKIRLQVDQNNLTILEHEEDVHVLTGTLKLFFRELKKPLIPFEHFNKALKASTNPNKKEKLQHFREIVKALPQANRDTLEFLLRHLLRVTGYQEFNRMHIPNLAIVFGPTLMWPEAESLNMALDLMQQNLVIECFLQEFDNIFR